MRKPADFKKYLEAIGEYLQEKPGWSLLIIGFLFFVYGLVIMGSYAFESEALVNMEQSGKLKTELYQTVIGQLKQRETRLQQGIAQEYPDIFR